LPYQKFIRKGYDDPIITAHIVNRKLDKSGRPATLSHDIMTKLLRYEMDFDGVIISDDMQMALSKKIAFANLLIGFKD
jgi:beta-N-acetylhexosaminidase